MTQARYGSINSIYAIERKAAFIATFLSNDPAEFSFSDLRSRITTSRGTATTLKLSQKKLAWGEKNPTISERSTSAMIPYGSAELEFIRQMFTETRHPCVLLCVIRTLHKPGFRYEILAFRLQTERDVQLFIDLFTTLTQRQIPDVVRVQSRATTLNRDEPLYPASKWSQTRLTSTKPHKSVSGTLPPGTMPSIMSPQSLVDGEAIRLVSGNARGKQLYTTADSFRLSGVRQLDTKTPEIQPRDVMFAATRPGLSSVRRSETEDIRQSTESAVDRTFITRDVGVMADLDSWTPRSRPGDYLPLEGGLSSHHDRIYMYDDGSQVGDVFCQTNLRSPPRTVSHRQDSPVFVWNSTQGDDSARTRTEKRTGFEHQTVSQVFGDGVDEVDSFVGHEQSIPRIRQRRRTLVDNGVVKVTVEEYQDPVETNPEELSPGVQSSSLTTTESDKNYEHRETSRNHTNRLQTVSGGFRRSLRADEIDGDRSRLRILGNDTTRLPQRPPAMTSSVQRVFSRPSGPKLSVEAEKRISHPVEVRQTQMRRRSSYRDDRGYSVERPHTIREDVFNHQSQSVAVRKEPMSYPVHHPYTMHEPVYQSQHIIIRDEPTNSEKKRYSVKSSYDTHDSVYQSQPITIRVEPMRHPIRHRSNMHESVYQSQPITISAEPTRYPIRHRSNMHESLYQSKPIIVRHKSVNSDYRNETIDVCREPRNEYRLVAGPSYPVTLGQSRRSTIHKLDKRTSRK